MRIRPRPASNLPNANGLGEWPVFNAEVDERPVAIFTVALPVAPAFTVADCELVVPVVELVDDGAGAHWSLVPFGSEMQPYWQCCTSTVPFGQRHISVLSSVQL